MTRAFNLNNGGKPLKPGHSNLQAMVEFTFRYINIRAACLSVMLLASTQGAGYQGSVAQVDGFLLPAFTLFSIYSCHSFTPLFSKEKLSLPELFPEDKAEESFDQTLIDREEQFRKSSCMTCNEFGIWLSLPGVDDRPDENASDSVVEVIQPLPDFEEYWYDEEFSAEEALLMHPLAGEAISVKAPLTPPPQDNSGTLLAAFPWSSVLLCPSFEYKEERLTTADEINIDSYTCVACMEIAVDKDPHFINNCTHNHIYCAQCANKLYGGATTNVKCAKCQKIGDLAEDKRLKAQFWEIFVKCPENCGQVFKIYDLFDTHLQQCKTSRDCTHCGKRVSATGYLKHVAECLQVNKVKTMAQAAQAISDMAGIMQDIYCSLEVLRRRRGRSPESEIESPIPEQDAELPKKQVVSVEKYSVAFGSLELLYVPGYDRASYPGINYLCCTNNTRCANYCFFEIIFACERNNEVYQHKISKTFELKLASYSYKYHVSFDKGQISLYHQAITPINCKWQLQIVMVRNDGVLHEIKDHIYNSCGVSHGISRFSSPGYLMTKFRQENGRIYCGCLAKPSRE